MENFNSKNVRELNEKECISINGGWGGGGSLGYAYTAAAHEMGDFFRGVLHGLSSMWK